MIPLSIKEVRESSRSNMNKLVEDCWDNGLSVDLEVHACLLCQSEKLLKHKSSRFLKDWVNTRVNQSSVTFSILLSNQDLILDMEMRNVVLKVDVFRNDKAT